MTDDVAPAGYLRTQPLDSRKTGFGSHDCKRRDQFTKYIETERYREQLKAEYKLLRKTAIPVVSDAALDTARSTATAKTVSAKALQASGLLGYCV